VAASLEIQYEKSNREQLARCLLVQKRSQLERYVSRLQHWHDMKRIGYPVDEKEVAVLKAGVKKFTEELENMA
jgi:hypothetical protein